MLNISGKTSDFTLDLNESRNDIYTLLVTSNGNDGNFLPFGIAVNSDPNHIFTKVAKGNELTLEFDLENIKSDQYIWLKNTHKEFYRITIKPNIEASREKSYTFKLGKVTTDGKKIMINVVSKETKYSLPWEITYNGVPYEYDINKLKTKFSAELKTVIPSSATSTFILAQDESGKELSFNLFHKDNDSVELIKG